MAAGGGGDGDVLDPGGAVLGGVGREELLGVDGLVEGDAGEFEIDSEEDPTVRCQSDGSDVEVGDGRPGQVLSGSDERRKAFEDGGEP